MHVEETHVELHRSWQAQGAPVYWQPDSVTWEEFEKETQRRKSINKAKNSMCMHVLLLTSYLSKQKIYFNVNLKDPY